MFQFAPIDPRIQHLLEKRSKGNRNAHLDGERTKILTDYFKSHEAEPYDLKWAHYLYEWCAKKTIRVEPDDVFVGNMGRNYRDLLLFIGTEIPLFFVRPMDHIHVQSGLQTIDLLAGSGAGHRLDFAKMVLDERGCLGVHLFPVDARAIQVTKSGKRLFRRCIRITICLLYFRRISDLVQIHRDLRMLKIALVSHGIYSDVTIFSRVETLRMTVRSGHEYNQQCQ